MYGRKESAEALFIASRVKNTLAFLYAGVFFYDLCGLSRLNGGCFGMY